MRLLVSVRNAAEAANAVAGGADIVDAKDPTGGPIAPVSPAELAAIRAVVPEDQRLSAAFGDMATPLQITQALAAVSVRVGFVKLGFRGIGDAGRILRLLRAAVESAALLPGRPAVIAVGYADALRTGSLPPARFPDLISEAGAHGLLVDTCFKDGGDLFAFLTPGELTALGKVLERDELLFALGGSLSLHQVPAVRKTGAAVLGVRGAACRNGRAGEVDQSLVRRLADAVRQSGPLPVVTH